MNPNFNLSQEENTLVLKIERRIRRIWPDENSMWRVMDIVAVHNHICRLRLTALLNADDFNFAHDVMGIGQTPRSGKHYVETWLLAPIFRIMALISRIQDNQITNDENLLHT